MLKEDKIKATANGTNVNIFTTFYFPKIQFSFYHVQL